MPSSVSRVWDIILALPGILDIQRNAGESLLGKWTHYNCIISTASLTEDFLYNRWLGRPTVKTEHKGSSDRRIILSLSSKWLRGILQRFSDAHTQNKCTGGEKSNIVLKESHYYCESQWALLDKGWAAWKTNFHSFLLYHDYRNISLTTGQVSSKLLQISPILPVLSGREWTSTRTPVFIS